MFKKVVCFFCALVMSVSFLALPVSAEEEPPLTVDYPAIIFDVLVKKLTPFGVVLDTVDIIASVGDTAVYIAENKDDASFDVLGALDQMYDVLEINLEIGLSSDLRKDLSKGICESVGINYFSAVMIAEINEVGELLNTFWLFVTSNPLLTFSCSISVLGAICLLFIRHKGAVV